jgi:hypothetical protein
MKNIILACLICCVLFSCSKSKKSKNNVPASVITSYNVNVNVGGKVYSSSNSTVYNSAASNYQWDGLSIYFNYPACSAYNTGGFYQVSLWDTAGGAITTQQFLEFALPGVKNISNYYSPLANIYFLDTGYSGSAFVSATIANNGNHTCNVTFNLQGRVASYYSLDSMSFSAAGTFTNAPYY